MFNVLKEKFRPQHLEITLSLQYCDLYRKENESTQECFGRLNVKAVECCYKKHDRRLKEQFINVIDNEEIMQEIIKELVVQKIHKK